ncbi:MAG: hypothetical protein K2J63_01290 [Muribaculaceae bacterium]|nr:hypothetical protein [Muribaculaceae bacterium]MDE6335277.1 hypothetical protein [Muribaculaceae bacterium]MDE6793922.1 hypothetical protein [Muribaculaceae bacterium]
MNVYERIVELLKQEPILQDFKYVKSEYAFVKRVNGVKYWLHLYHVFTFNISMTIQPAAYVRYDVLEKWWERFDFRSTRDHRGLYTVGVSTDMIGFYPFFDFDYDGSNFDEMYPLLREATIQCVEYTFSTFKTMEDFYKEKVLPILEGKNEPPQLGSTWVFEYLTAGRILYPESYEKIKEIVMYYVEQRTLSGEPGIIKYKGKWGEILAYLESLDFSSGKAKLPKK